MDFEDKSKEKINLEIMKDFMASILDHQDATEKTLDRMNQKTEKHIEWLNNFIISL